MFSLTVSTGSLNGPASLSRSRCLIMRLQVFHQSVLRTLVVHSARRECWSSNCFTSFSESSVIESPSAFTILYAVKSIGASVMGVGRPVRLHSRQSQFGKGCGSWKVSTTDMRRSLHTHKRKRSDGSTVKGSPSKHKNITFAHTVIPEKDSGKVAPVQKSFKRKTHTLYTFPVQLSSASQPEPFRAARLLVSAPDAYFLLGSAFFRP